MSRENINYVKKREFCVRCNFFQNCILSFKDEMKRGSNWVPSSFHLINCSLKKAEKKGVSSHLLHSKCEKSGGDYL